MIMPRDCPDTIIGSPHLRDSQLSFRIGLARTRTAAYPLNSLDFIMMDLERPEMCSRHADWCTGDLTGRLLEFLSCAEDVDGRSDERLPGLFERILKQRRPSGLFGRYAGGSVKVAPEEDFRSGGDRLFSGLIRYYKLTGDWRALEAASGVAERLLSVKGDWKELLKGPRMPIEAWVTEPLAELYGLTGDERYLDFCMLINEQLEQFVPGQPQSQHAHGFLSILRGLQLMAYYTGDDSWNHKPERFRQEILAEHRALPDGCISEYIMPNSSSTEGCAIADWVMLNLNAALISDSDSAYDEAEWTLWNALFHNQFVTGGFGTRSITPRGYGTDRWEECWWCCNHHCGRAITEYARHAVSWRRGTVAINFLVPGTYDLEVPGRPPIVVDIRTNYPAGAEAVIEVGPIGPESLVKVRTPPWICEPSVKEQRQADRIRLTLTGQIGHRLIAHQEGVLLTYGPLVLAPLIGAPRGSSLTLLCETGGPGGFLDLDNQPLPECEWSYFDEGPGARCAVGQAAVHVPVRLPDGCERLLRFWPLCYNTSNLSYNETPIIFTAEE